MIKIEKTDVSGFEQSIRGMRNPMNSWDKIDSEYKYCKDIKGSCNQCPLENTENTNKYCDNSTQFFCIGENDLTLMKKLAKAGADHRKFMRMITVYVDITAPLYWWKEYDTYKVGTVANSCSCMHKLHEKKLTIHDFSHENLEKEGNKIQQIDVPFKKEGEEKWVEFDDGLFYFSNFGRLKMPSKTITDTNGKKRVFPEKIKDKFSINSSGYKKITIHNGYEYKNYYIHRLIATAFIQNENNFKQVNHIDGNKQNNNLSNLEWCDAKYNKIHSFKNKTSYISGYNRYKVAKKFRMFNEAEILNIFERFENGETKKSIADSYKCYGSTISDIINGNKYKEIHLTPYDSLKITIDEINFNRELYLETKDKKYWWQMIQLLPSSYNQKRTVQVNYEVLMNIYNARKSHKLDEWQEFCKWIETLPYSELITG